MIYRVKYKADSKIAAGITLLLAILLVSLTSCESPADVDADRKVIREYDPELTGIRLKVHGQKSKYFGQYQSNKQNLYQYRIENISGEAYEIKDIVVEWQNDSMAGNRALVLDIPETPLTLGTGGDGAFLDIGVSFEDVKLLNEMSGTKYGKILVIGEIDTVQFQLSYDLPPLYIDLPRLNEVRQNSNIPINILLYNFSDISNSLLEPEIIPADPNISMLHPKVFPLQLGVGTPSTLQLLFNGRELGNYDFTIPLLYQKRFPGAADKIELSIEVIK